MICRSKEFRNPYNVYMETITEQQENEINDSIDQNNNLYFIKDNKVIAKGKDIILYGKVDLDNPQDLYYIKKFDLINEENSLIYTNLDFNTGDVQAVDGKIRKCHTFNPIKWFKYNHLLLGKPERIIIYKIKPIHNYGRTNRYNDCQI